MNAERMPRLFTRFRARLLFTVLLIVMLVQGVCFVLTYRFVIEHSQRANEHQTIDAFAKVEHSIEQTLEGAMNFSLLIQSEPTFDQYIHREYRTSVRKSQMEVELVSQLDRYLTAYSNLSAVIFFQEGGQVGGSSYPRAYFFRDPDHPFYSSDAYLRALQNPGKTLWDTGHLRYYYSQSEPNQAAQPKDIMITSIRAFRSGAADSPHTVLLVSINESTLRRFYDQLAEEASSIVLLNERGALFSGMPMDRFGQVPDYYSRIDPNAQYGSFSHDAGEPSQIIYYRMSSTGWLMVKTVPLRIYGQDMRIIGERMTQITLFTMLLIAVFMLGSIVHFTKPVEALTSTMIRTGEGRLDLRAEADSPIYEIRQLGLAFNRMLDNINSLFSRVQRAEEEKAALEIRALQNQIKPHFIYNTITSIRWMATLRGDDGVADALVMLIKLLRPVYDGPAVYWTLGEEIAFLENYSELMRMRTGKDVRLQVDCAESDLRDMMLPRFLLQPAVENSFEHGLAGRDRMSIHIALQRDDGKSTTLYVRDDGAGMPRAKLDILRQRLCAEPDETQAPASPRQGIGLRNCHQRLRLIYGPQSGLHVQNSDGGGLLVAYRIVQTEKSVNCAIPAEKQ